MGIGTKKGRSGGIVALATVFALLTSGCSEAPQPLPTHTEGLRTTTPTPVRPQPSASVPAMPVPTSVADQPAEELLERVNGFVARPDALQLRDGDGDVVASLSYMSSPADAIAALTTVFGEPPLDEEYRGTNHTPPGVLHQWGALVIDERFYDEQRRIEDQLDYLRWPRFAVYFDGPAANDMPLSSVQGIQAGDSWDFAASSPGFQSEVFTCMGAAVEVLDVERPDGTVTQATVVVVEESATVTMVSAPEMVSSGCA